MEWVLQRSSGKCSDWKGKAACYSWRGQAKGCLSYSINTESKGTRVNDLLLFPFLWILLFPSLSCFTMHCLATLGIICSGVAWLRVCWHVIIIYVLETYVQAKRFLGSSKKSARTSVTTCSSNITSWSVVFLREKWTFLISLGACSFSQRALE